MKEVIDTRFLREYFFTNQNETKQKTIRKLQDLLAKNEGILPTIVIAEVTQIICQIRGKDVAQSRYQSISQSGLKIQDLTPQIAKQAGFLKCTHKNLPMGDCIIAATAIENHANVLSDDPHFDCIKETKRIWI